MNQATARLRKTFQYPTDNDQDDDLPEALDEEEQVHLIQTLQKENLTRNTQSIYILLTLSLLCIIPYTTTLFSPPTSLLSILSITSLLSTAYLLHTLPPEITAIPFLDDLRPSPPSSSSASARAGTGARARRNALRSVGLGGGDDGPIIQYLPYLNIGLCVALLLLSLGVGRKVGLWWGFGWVPAGLYSGVLVAKYIMGGVDPEGELGSLKYGYKGA